MENELNNFEDSPLGYADELIERFNSQEHLDAIAATALEEDLGSGDVSAAIFHDNEPGKAFFLAKEAGILSGKNIVEAVFRKVNPAVKIRWTAEEGNRFEKGDILAHFEGPIKSLLEGERTALNFIQHLSGIAGLTRQYVEALSPNSTMRIYDTRKTLPLLRALEKKAVRDGGGSSHRYALYDMAMLKNNHIDAAGGITAAVNRLKSGGFFDKKPRLGLCIETRDLKEALEAAENLADIIMLDNMDPKVVPATVEAIRKITAGKNREMPLIEISGGITLEKLPELSHLPVDRVSIGAITHSVSALDIAMRYSLDN